MAQTGIGLLDSLAGSMRTLTRKQAVIAENIANADTPGFRARALAEDGFASKLGPAVAPTARMAALGAKTPLPARGIVEAKSEVKPNGNSVSLEDQMLEMGRVQTDYAAATALYRKSVGLLKIALGRSPA
jgi:flagellar basal-body rod protein FlgB